jgi:hypothetical protein
MAKWTKPPQGLVDLFHDGLPRDGRVRRQTLFGCPCVSVNGNMAAGVFQEGVFARLGPETWAALAREGATGFEPMPGRPSKTYLMLTDDMLADEERLPVLLAEAVAVTGEMPAKPPKAPRKRRAGDLP